jgi:hypothetical protein
MHDNWEPVPEPGPRRVPPPPRRPTAPPGASDPEDPRTTPWEALIAQGKERGYVTIVDIGAVFDTLDQHPPADLRPLYEALRATGIAVVTGAPKA